MPYVLFTNGKGVTQQWSEVSYGGYGGSYTFLVEPSDRAAWESLKKEAAAAVDSGDLGTPFCDGVVIGTPKGLNQTTMGRVEGTILSATTTDNPNATKYYVVRVDLSGSTVTVTLAPSPYASFPLTGYLTSDPTQPDSTAAQEARPQMVGGYHAGRGLKEDETRLYEVLSSALNVTLPARK